MQVDSWKMLEKAMGICSGTMVGAYGTSVPATFLASLYPEGLDLGPVGIMPLKMHTKGWRCSSLGKHFLSAWGGLVVWSTLGPGFA